MARPTRPSDAAQLSLALEPLPLQAPPRLRTEPAVATIPAYLPFLDTLALRLRAHAGRDPLELAAATVLLPTRRAALALGEAFLRVAEGRPLLLPRLIPLGDLEAEELALGSDDLELPPPLPEAERLMVLARLVRQWGAFRDERILPGRALELAGELVQFLSRVEAEGVSLDRLKDLAPADHAEHWQLTLDFLEIVRTQWPAYLAGAGALDPAIRRNRVIEAQIALWRRTPPQGLVVAAGLASADPKVRDLLNLVARLPAGEVVLPGLDREADDETWECVVRDDTHPQRGMAELLAEMAWDRRLVRVIAADGEAERRGSEASAGGDASHDAPTAVGRQPASAGPGLRAVLIREVMRPAETSERWRHATIAGASLDGITQIACPGPAEEAASIALLLRRELEQPGNTAMLVTPDRLLARRVAAELGRFGIEIDDSGGRPLGGTPPGVFLRLLASAAADAWAPVPLLALLKHPLATGAGDPAAFRAAVRGFERAQLRGNRPAPGLAGLKARAASDEARALITDLERHLGGFARMMAQGEHPLAELLETHLAAGEALAGAERLWAEEAGSALARLTRELLSAARSFGRLQGSDYPASFEALLAPHVVRPAFGRHPRLRILGLLEARLQQADLVILGGLVEGTWPAEPRTDPWLSRPMARNLGLAAADRRVGQSAHDFAQALAAPRVVLTRALRVDGVPTVPSRWLMRLETVCAAAGLAPAEPTFDPAAVALALDRPAQVRPVGRPEPKPPLSARPRRFSVTDVETWRRDPYSLYAKRVLRLAALKPLDQPLGRADLGNWIHKALGDYVAANPDTPPSDIESALIRFGHAAFGRRLDEPEVWAFWWPRYESIVRFVGAQERMRRPGITTARSEVKGLLSIDAPAGAVILEGRADRIDMLAGGGAAIIDYKTGRVPSSIDIAHGFAPQLPLEAAILAAGGYASSGLPPLVAEELIYWKLSGGQKSGEAIPLKEAATLVRQTLDGVAAHIAAYDDEARAYPARPWPGREPSYSDYGHLARTQEWSGGGGS